MGRGARGCDSVRCMDAAEWVTQPFGGDAIEWAALVLRIAVGVIFIDAGLGKFRRGIGGFSGWLESLGIPMARVAGPGVATLELVGGAMIFLGLMTSWIAIPLALNMVVATWVNKFKEGAPFQGSSEQQGYELDILLGLACVALVLSGSGALSLDRLIG